MDDKQQFIREVAAHARTYMKETKVLASLTIAQAILESNWGRSSLARNQKNLFGIKGRGKPFQTKEFVDGKWLTVSAQFRTYDSFAGSVRDHNLMLRRLPRYKEVIGERDFRKACLAIQAAGYATDPQYAQKLITLIETWKLTQYDLWEEKCLSIADANQLIRLIQDKWSAAQTVVDRAEWHRLANLCRQLSGQPLQK